MFIFIILLLAQSIDTRCFALSHFMDSLHLLTFNAKDIENMWNYANDLLYSNNQYAKEVIFKFAGKIMIVFIKYI